MVAHGLPVVAAFRAGTDLQPLPDLLLEDVIAVRGLARLRIDPGENILKDRLFVIEELARSCGRASTGCRLCRW